MVGSFQVLPKNFNATDEIEDSLLKVMATSSGISKGMMDGVIHHFKEIENFLTNTQSFLVFALNSI